MGLFWAVFVAGIGIATAWATWFASGDLVVVASPRSELTVIIDGEPTLVLPGRSQTISVKRGARSIVLQSDAGRTEQTLEIVDGYSRYLVAAKDQCFVLVDIAKSHYRREGDVGPPPPPRLVTRVYPGERCLLSGNVYLPGREPPGVYSQRDVSLVLVREIDCVFFGTGIGERRQLEAIGLQ